MRFAEEPLSNTRQGLGHLDLDMLVGRGMFLTDNDDAQTAEVGVQVPGRLRSSMRRAVPHRFGLGIFCDRRATVRGVSTETAARPRPLRLTQARVGDTLHDGDGIRVTIVNAFTTLKPETEATVRAVDYLVVDAMAPDQFRVYSDDERDVARWRRVETPESP